MQDRRSIYMIWVNDVDEADHDMMHDNIIKHIESNVTDDLDDFYGEEDMPWLPGKKFTICQMGDSIEQSRIDREAQNLCLYLQIVFEMRKTPLLSEYMIIGTFENKKWRTLYDVKNNINLFHGLLSGKPM